MPVLVFRCPPALRLRSSGLHSWWWPCQSRRHGFAVLDDSGEVELIAGTGEVSQSHAFKALMGLEMGELHLDLLAIIP